MNVSSLLIFSDYEPDDFLALWILSIIFKIGTLVITENKSDVLQQKCMDAAYFFPNFKIYRGATSRTEFDFKKEGNITSTFPIYHSENQIPPSIVFGLSPIRDIKKISWENPNFFKGAQTFFYGGFNFATVISTMKEFDWTTWFQQTFARVVIFEKKTMFGKFDTFTRSSGPLLPTIIQHQQNSVYAKRFLSIIYTWNNHLHAKLLQDVNEYIEKHAKNGIGIGISNWDNIYRKIEIIKGIENDNYQVVAADPAVTVLYDEDIRSPRLHPISFVLKDDGIFEYVDVAFSKVYLFKAHDEAATHSEVEQKITSLILWGTK